MRLLNASKSLTSGDLIIEPFVGLAPQYAILSHTWTDEEVTLQDISLPGVRKMKGYTKIMKTCEQAVRDGFSYAWVDTCCIDKSSSAELSEAINSMYKWYEHAGIAYAYFEDLPGDTPTLEESELRRCRWFTRGWTLQELIAPAEVIIFDAVWNARGRKTELPNLLDRITGIDGTLLRSPGNRSLKTIPIARRMSWAAGRRTTRDEDVAYSLMGIFDVNMPLLYGEGKKAFVRLQEAILAESTDPTIFAWQAALVEHDTYRSILARSPDEFASASNISRSMQARSTDEYTLTNKGVKMTVALTGFYGSIPRTVLRLNCFSDLNYYNIGIILKKIGPAEYVRAEPCRFAKHIPDGQRNKSVQIYLKKDLSMESHNNSYVDDGGFGTIIRFPLIFSLSLFDPIYMEPSELWDDAERAFKTYLPGRFVSVITFAATLASEKGLAGIMFWIVCGSDREDGIPWITLASERTSPGITSLFKDLPLLRRLIGKQYRHKLHLYGVRGSSDPLYEVELSIEGGEGNTTVGVNISSFNSAIS